MLETNKSLDNPRIFRIKILPINESDRLCHHETLFSNLETLRSQLSWSILTVPKTIPKIFIFFTQERPRGLSGLSFQAPSYCASVFVWFNLAPDPFSKSLIALNNIDKEVSFFTKAVVSSAY